MPKRGEEINLWTDPWPGNRAAEKADAPPAADVPRLKLFPLAGERARPWMIVLPGGGYRGRADHEADPVAEWFNGLGLNAAVCHYRVHPWRHPTPLLDAQRAVRLVRHHAAEWYADPGRIGILGFSAGGHLACSVANFGDGGDPEAADPVARQSARVHALIACYPVVSFGAKGHSGSMQNLLGRDPDAALRQRLSLETTVTADNPPAFLWHSANDPVVPVENSLLYAAALAAVKVPFALHVYPNAWHGIGLGRDFPGSARGWTQACEAWLLELGWR